jgi:hypothetical protein
MKFDHTHTSFKIMGPSNCSLTIAIATSRLPSLLQACRVAEWFHSLPLLQAGDTHL